MHIIQSQEHINSVLDTIYSDINFDDIDNNFISIDTEFIRENRETPLLCLLQIATKNNVFIIDTLAIDIFHFNKLFNDESIVKVFHSAEQDIEILFYNKISINNIYDTQLGEMFLSHNEPASYKKLVKKYLNKNIDKNHSVSDWEKRPLSPKQLEYSAADVIHLREIYKIQLQEIMNLGRKEWINEELKNMYNKVNIHFNNSETFPIFKDLIVWRDQRAEEINLDPESIVKIKTINKICKKGLDFVISMKNARLKKTEHMKDFLNFAETKVPIIRQENSNLSNISQIMLLKNIVHIKSMEHNINASILATKDDLCNIISGYDNVKCFSGWRKNIIGDELMNLMQGKIGITISNGMPTIVEKT